MKYFLLITILFLSIKIKAQKTIFEDDNIKIDLSNCDIHLQKYLEGKQQLYYEIENKSNYSIIFDPIMGFEGKTYIYENKVLLNPIKKKSYDGYYSGYEERECKDYFVILKKGDKKKIRLSIINVDGVVFEINKLKNYSLNINSIHNSESISRNGCESYINKNKMQGVKILNINIDMVLSILP